LFKTKYVLNKTVLKRPNIRTVIPKDGKLVSPTIPLAYSLKNVLRPWYRKKKPR
jgi:hypothetical protein